MRYRQSAVVVVDPFEVPDGPIEGGLRGRVLSEMLVDHLNRIRLSAKWVKEVAPRWEEPQTEIGGDSWYSILVEELSRIIKGEPKIISGSILETKDGIFLVARVRGNPGYSLFLGEGSRVVKYDLDCSLAKLAIHLFRDINPYVLALHFNNQGRYRECEETIRYILANEPLDMHADAYTLWGHILANEKNLDGALAALETAVSLDPKSSYGYNNLGFVVKGLKKPDIESARDSAMTLYQYAIRLDPENSLAYTNWAAALAQKGEYGEAILKAKKAIELDPLFAWPHNNLGYVLFLQGDSSKLGAAARSCERAIVLDPEYVRAYESLAEIRKAQGKNYESEILLNEASQLQRKKKFVPNNEKCQ